MKNQKYIIKYTNGKEKVFYKLSVNKIQHFKKMYQELRILIKDREIFDISLGDTYKIYQSSEPFKNALNKIYEFLGIDYNLLDVEDLFDLILPWEELKENESLIHYHGKLYGFIFPNSDKKNIISNKILDKATTTIRKTFEAINNIDILFNHIAVATTEEVEQFQEIINGLEKTHPKVFAEVNRKLESMREKVNGSRS